jgi:hypothetical protein
MYRASGRVAYRSPKRTLVVLVGGRRYGKLDLMEVVSVQTRAISIVRHSVLASIERSARAPGQRG